MGKFIRKAAPYAAVMVGGVALGVVLCAKTSVFDRFLGAGGQ